MRHELALTVRSARGGRGRLARSAVGASALVALAMGALVACGDDDGTTTAATTTAVPGTTQPSAGATSPADASVEIFLLADGGDCDEVVAVERDVPGEGDLEAAMVALAAGPTDDERARGLGGWFSAETEGLVASATVEGSVARVDLDPSLPSVIPNASTSCGSMGLLAQLQGTAHAATDVDSVVYSLGGDVDAFYLWLQLVPPTTS